MEGIVTEKMCACCQEIKSINDFFRFPSSNDKFDYYCKECRANPKRVKHTENKREYGKKNKRLEIIKALGGRCVRCGFRDFRALQIDHVNGNGNRERKELGHNKIYSKIYKEVTDDSIKVKGYQLLCANCNWIKRYENKETANGYTKKR